MLSEITETANDSVKLAHQALREGRDRLAHEFAHEAWNLRQSREAAAIGLLAATGLSDPIEIPRWIRRRRALPA